jgi:predicted phage-related endonuclease
VVERDQQLINGWVMTLRAWWERHVVAGVPPEPRSQATAKRYLAERYPVSRGNILPAAPADLELGLGLVAAKARAKAAAEEVEAYQNAIKARIGSADGIAGVATWKTDALGAVSWKSVAEAMGAPLATIERFRGAPSRRFLLKTKGA